MATTEIVILSDSLDERIKNGVETVTFFHPVTGVKLEIELGEANRNHFANHLAKIEKYIDAAREVETKPAKKTAVKADSEISKIRVWAQANGYKVGDRGRIAAEIVEAYYKAQDKAETEAVASVALDGETQVIDDVDPLDAGTFASSNPPADLDKTVSDEVDSDMLGSDTELSDEDIFDILSEIDKETDGSFTLDDVAAKVDSTNE